MVRPTIATTDNYEIRVNADLPRKSHLQGKDQTCGICMELNLAYRAR